MKWGRAALALAVAAYGATAVADEPLVANPPLPTIALTLTARGKPQRYTVEVAKSTVEQARGLMLRKVMGRGHGMLFPVAPPPHDVSFWMEGTYLPLDIIFIAPDHKVRRIAANAVPFSRTDIPSGGPTAAVLELNAGEAARIGLQPGDSVAYSAD